MAVNATNGNFSEQGFASINFQYPSINHDNNMLKNKKGLFLKKNLYWTPRILAILFIAFISIFALDVFNEPQWFLALFMHLIPSFILVILTIIAWKHEQSGGFIFIIIGSLMLVFSHFESIIISIPAIVIGILFIGKKLLVKS